MQVNWQTMNGPRSTAPLKARVFLVVLGKGKPPAGAAMEHHRLSQDSPRKCIEKCISAAQHVGWFAPRRCWIRKTFWSHVGDSFPEKIPQILEEAWVIWLRLGCWKPAWTTWSVASGGLGWPILAQHLEVGHHHHQGANGSSAKPQC